MKIDYCSVGHVALDLISDKQHPGGSVLFGTSLASELDQKCGAVTSSAVSFPYAEFSDIEWSIQFAAQTTTYVHEYSEHHRTSKLLKKADVILPQSVTKSLRHARVVMLSPIVDEIQPDLASIFSTPFIGLTPQGWLRKFDENGNMSSAKSLYTSLPKKIKLIVVSSEDLAPDSEDWSWIKKSAEVAVCTMGREGYVLAYGTKEQQYAPREVMKEKNPTGCGDIFSTATLLLLAQGLMPEVACEKAGHAAALASTQDQMMDSIRIAAKELKGSFLK